MSFEPSQEDINRANPDVGIQTLKAELAAEGKTIADISDEELGKRARQVGLDADEMQSQYSIKRRPGEGYGFEKVKQRTAAQIIRGNQEPPPAFFAGIPEAMQQALAGINQQRIDNEVPVPFVSANQGRDVETRELPVNLEVRYGKGTTQKTRAPLAKQRIRVRNEAVGGRTREDIVKEKNADNLAIQQLENRLGSVAAGEAMLGSAVDYLDPSKPSFENEAVRQQQTGAQRLNEELQRLRNKTRLTPEEEQSVRSGDVAGQNVMAAMQGGPEVRAEYMNKRLAAELAKMDAAGQEVMDEDIVRIRTEIMEDVLTNVYREQDLSSAQLGVAVDANSGMFKSVNVPDIQKQPLQSGVGQSGDARGLIGDVREVFRPNDVQFVDTTWKHYTGVLTPEKRERALNDLKVYRTLSKEEKFPPELMDVVKTVAASKPGFGAGRQLSYTEIKDYLSRISYVESKHKNISQIGGGPAVSAFQVEPITAESLINLERISKKYFNSSSFNETLDDEFDRVAETNPELMSGYLSYKNQGEDKAVYKAMQDLSIEQIIKLMSISPAFAGSMAYAKIITGLKGNVRKKDKKELD